MSIAASVVIKPSRLLRVLQLLLGVTILALAARLVLFEFSTLPSTRGCGLAALVALSGCALLYSAFRERKSFQLDISGIGAIRLREHYTRAGPAPLRSSGNGGATSTENLRLMPGSTIWPGLLALQLQHASRGATWLLVLPDMTGDEAFRALSIALRWIAANEDTNAGEEN